MKQIPIGLEALRMLSYKDPRERWAREDWLEFGGIMDKCSEEHNNCKRKGCKASCDDLMACGVKCSPSQFGHKEKANAKTRGSTHDIDRSESWIPTFTTGFKDEILRY